MEKEMEVKVLGIDPKDIENKLKEIGAHYIKKEHQINSIYDNNEREIKNVHNGYLRIRESKDLDSLKTEYIFTLKTNKGIGDLRENIETSTKIQNKEALEIILKTLGLKKVHEGSKTRISYKYENIRFDIDTWDKETYPHPYLEIEVEDKNDLEKAIELLDINREKVTSKSLAQLRIEIGLGDL